MALTYRNGVSIAEIIVYVPCLAVAVFLAIRHGFRRNSGWLFLIVFCLARIIGPCMQLATISQPRTISLYTGSAILQNIGLSPLELAAIGLLSRLVESINKSHRTLVGSKVFKFIELIIMVGLILGIVGGINASSAYVASGGKPYHPGTLNKAGTALFIVSYVAVVVTTVIVSFSTRHAEHGEKRLLSAVAISLPFLLVRLIYSVMSTFTTNKSFNLLNGNVTVLLCVALIEEFIVVISFEAVGLTLHQIPKAENIEARQESGTDSATPTEKQKRGGGADNMALKIAKKTIIGRIVMSMVASKSGNVEE